MTPGLRFICKVIIPFILGNVNPFSIDAQNSIYFDQYTSEDGLSENVVYCIHQDKRGFMWFGTDYGLNRFDGYSFKHYFFDRNDTTTLSNHSIFSLAEDSLGNFWIGTFGCLNYFNPHTGHSDRYVLPCSPDIYIVEIREAGNKILMLLSSFELFTFDRTDHSFCIIPNPDRKRFSDQKLYKFPDNSVAYFTKAENDKQEIAIIDPNTLSLAYKPIQDLFPFAKGIAAFHYFNCRDGSHLFFSRDNQSLYEFDKQGKFVVKLEKTSLGDFDQMDIYAMKEISPKAVLLGTKKGLFIYDRQKQSIEFPDLKLGHQVIPGAGEARTMFQDHDGNIWLGTFGEGLILCHTRPLPVSHITPEDLHIPPSQRMIYGLHPWPDGDIAAKSGGNNFSLIRNREATEYITQQELPNHKQIELSTGKNLNALSPFQRMILTDSMGSTGAEFIPFSYLLHDDTTVIYYYRGIKIFRPVLRKVISYDFVFNYTQDESYFWFASENGLYRLDKKNLTDTVYRSVASDKFSISESSLYYVYKDSMNNLWIGTKGGGLNYFDRTKNTFVHYTTEDGLPDNVVYTILPDQKGHLWLSTNKGISCFDIDRKTFTNFSRRDGLLNTEFNRQGCFVDADGYMYFAGTSGIDYFKPENLLSARDSTTILISGLRVNDGKVTEMITAPLKYDQNDVTIYFTANEFIYPELVYYRYRLSDDDPWTRVQGIPYANYNRLSPGEYLFVVQSSVDNVLWSEAESFPFQINAPWWNTWWFYLSMVSIILLSFYLFYQYRIDQVKKLAKLRTKISRDLHDEVGSSLSSIHVYSSVASKTLENNMDVTKNALVHIHQNARQVMEDMSDIVWAIQTGEEGKISLEDKLKNYGYELLTPLNINVTYNIDPEAEKKLNHIEARKNILLIAKEAMNNIARYSRSTEASVRMVLENKQLLLEIKDNGKGFNPASGRHGNGLANMQHRTETMGGNFMLATAENEGTSLTFSFPIARFSRM